MKWVTCKHVQQWLTGQHTLDSKPNYPSFWVWVYVRCCSLFGIASKKMRFKPIKSDLDHANRISWLEVGARVLVLAMSRLPLSKPQRDWAIELKQHIVNGHSALSKKLCWERTTSMRLQILQNSLGFGLRMCVHVIATDWNHTNRPIYVLLFLFVAHSTIK